MNTWWITYLLLLKIFTQTPLAIHVSSQPLGKDLLQGFSSLRLKHLSWKKQEFWRTGFDDETVGEWGLTKPKLLYFILKLMNDHLFPFACLVEANKDECRIRRAQNVAKGHGLDSLGGVQFGQRKHVVCTLHCMISKKSQTAHIYRTAHSVLHLSRNHCKMTLKLASKLFGGLEDLLNLLRLWVLTIKSTVHDDIHEFQQRVLASQFPPAVNMNTLFISFLIHFSSSKTSHTGPLRSLVPTSHWRWTSPKRAPSDLCLRTWRNTHGPQDSPQHRVNSRSVDFSLDFSMLAELRIDTLWIENDENIWKCLQAYKNTTSNYKLPVELRGAFLSAAKKQILCELSVFKLTSVHRIP